MNIKYKIGLFVVLLIGILMIGGCSKKEEAEIEKPKVPEPEVTEGEVLKLAVQPCWGPSDSFLMFTPLTDYLSEETGLNIKLAIVEDVDFHKRFATFDFVLQDSFAVYVHNKLIATSTPLVIAVSEKGESVEKGAIIVKADSNIKNISDLKGKTFLFGAAHNAPKFLAAFATMKKSGINPDKDLKSYDLGGDCSNNTMSVFLGEYDAGVVCKDFIEGKEGKRKFNFETDLRVIADTMPVPNWMLTASENVRCCNINYANFI
ncbi:MAG: PhnD/SsuA/transferrin family substrate-binding protein [Nitrospirota bacterium]